MVPKFKDIGNRVIDESEEEQDDKCDLKSDSDARKAVQGSYLFEAIQTSPEMAMHDSIITSAEDVYSEIYGNIPGINFLWDNEASVWVATSEDVPGLVLESDSLETLKEKIKAAIPELLASNQK